MTELEVGYEVVDMWEKSELDVAPNASEASNQLRRSPKSSNEVFGPFGVDMKSATGVVVEVDNCLLLLLLLFFDKRRGGLGKTLTPSRRKIL